MEKLIARPRAGRQRRAGRVARRQRGDILLVVMVFLLVCLLGLVVSMREGIVSTLMGGNNLARQRDVQVSDVATRQVEGLIQANYAGQPLELSPSASTQPWMRFVTSAGPATPTTAYWDACLGNTDTNLRCGSVTPTVNNASLGYSVLAVVQYTGRRDDYACQITGQLALFYDVFLHVKEANGITSSNIETVYRLCVPDPDLTH